MKLRCTNKTVPFLGHPVWCILIQYIIIQLTCMVVSYWDNIQGVRSSPINSTNNFRPRVEVTDKTVAFTTYEYLVICHSIRFLVPSYGTVCLWMLEILKVFIHLSGIINPFLLTILYISVSRICIIHCVHKNGPPLYFSNNSVKNNQF